ncbi:unnamed protein product [Microthlaspi erraticum]|uniref:Uncharacterized protein n=1 Tax=Microthlaspi erraticum TaxID=1685480 RepID=A0A6D2HPR2_9BRAS|nr:unnamed protein product [Microthlaspi erraticum]
MVEGESSNARRRLKMQADLERMTQRMEESDAEGYVYSEEKEGNGSPNEEGSDETESEEEGEEVNQLVDKSEQEVTKMSHGEAEPQEEEEKLPMYQEHYNALFSMDFVETKYPHDDTMKAWIFEMWSWYSRTCNWQVFSHRMESYKELTWREEDGNLQAARDTLWFTYGEGNLWNIKEMNSKEYWATIAEEGRPLVQSMREKSSSLTWELSPSSHAQGMGRRSEEIGHTQETSCLSLSSCSPTRSRPTTLGKREGNLVLEGHHANLVQLESN